MGTNAAASQTRTPRSIVQQKICILLAVPEEADEAVSKGKKGAASRRILAAKTKIIKKFREFLQAVDSYFDHATRAMFSLLAAAHGAHHVEITCTSASFCGLGAYEKSDDFSGHSMLASMPVGLDTAVSPELLSKEKLKAKLETDRRRMAAMQE